MYLSIDLIVIFLGGINYQSVNLISFLTPLRSFGFYPLEMSYTIINAMKMLTQQKHNSSLKKSFPIETKQGNNSCSKKMNQKSQKAHPLACVYKLWTSNRRKTSREKNYTEAKHGNNCSDKVTLNKSVFFFCIVISLSK